MTTALISVLGFGLLFAVFGVLRLTTRRCGGNCGACASSCTTIQRQDES
jgi:hypothetical protein